MTKLRPILCFSILAIVAFGVNVQADKHWGRRGGIRERRGNNLPSRSLCSFSGLASQ